MPRGAHSLICASQTHRAAGVCANGDVKVGWWHGRCEYLCR